MSSIATESLGQTLSRFNAVMAARATTQELLGLFEKLAVSDKFADRHKGACFGRLIETAMARIRRDSEKSKGYARLVYDAALHIPDSQVFNLLQAVERSPAGKDIYAGYPYERVEKIMGPMVRRLVALTPKTEADLAALFNRLLQGGLARQRVEIICMLLAAGMPESEVDPICDLTHHMEYGRTPRAVPQFEPELI